MSRHLPELVRGETREDARGTGRVVSPDGARPPAPGEGCWDTLHPECTPDASVDGVIRIALR